MRKTLHALFILGLALVPGLNLNAASLMVAGSSLGEFTGAGGYSSGFEQTVSIGPGATFQTSDPNGLVFAGNNPFSSDTNGLVIFGTFTLGSDQGLYPADTFSLEVTFTSPVGSTPNPVTYSSTVSGAVTSSFGAAGVDFAFPAQTIDYPDGSFTLTINSVNSTDPGNVFVAANSRVELTGTVTANAPTPEPGSVSLLSGGLLLVTGLAIRRAQLRKEPRPVD